MSTNAYFSRRVDEIIKETNNCMANTEEPILEWFQSNSEGEIVGKIHEAFDQGIDGVVINAGAYTHYSIAIHDALEILTCPKIEVHMSNIFAREEFRHKSVISSVCTGCICGFGKDSYRLAIDGLIRQINAV